MNVSRFGRFSLLLVICVGVLASVSMIVAQGDTPEPIVPLMSQEDAKAFAARFERIFNDGIDGPNLDIVDELFAEDFVGHLPLAPGLDREGWKAYVASFYEGTPDLRQTTTDVIVGEDRLVLQVSYTGTQTGTLLGIAPTGIEVIMTGTGVFTFNNEGLVIENRADLDVVGVLAQIGAFPTS
ncbi:MAG: ester cyclase [Chloroflexi bacterium]|nr:ester cyclase [Chloroflexota bacterium]